MSQYRYLSSDLISGEVKGDYLPLTTDSFGRVINGTGTFTGALNLTAGSAAEARTWRDAVEGASSVLWCFVGGVPVWNGIAWDQPHQSALDGTLPVTATTMESLFGHRYILDDLVFTDQDVFAIFRSLAVYALGKQNGGVAGLNLGTNAAGVTDTITYAGADEQQVLTAWTDLTAQYGFEFAFRPGIDASGNLATFLDLGFPQLGLQYPGSGLAYSFPGNLLDYAWPRTRSSGGNAVLGSAPNPASADGSNWTSQYPHGYDLNDLAAGFPLLEYPSTLSTSAVTSQGQVDAYADGVLPSVTGTMLTPLLTLGNDQGPAVADIVLGSWAQVALTSPLHPANDDGSPGWQGQGRIIGWTVYPPQSDTQAEHTELQCWMPDESSSGG
ncbi:MAG TPA: hypothetical protein VII33_13345 [Nakamurella sp.]